MIESDFPALYREANAASSRMQRTHFSLLAVNITALLVVTCMTAYPRQTGEWWLVAGLITCIGILSTGSALIWTPQGKWYQARAVAESVKTMVWRYITKAKPFDGAAADARALLLARMEKVLGEHKELAASMAPVSGVNQITAAIETARSSELGARLKLYVNQRVKSQGVWYARRAREHKVRQSVLLALFCGAMLAAVGLLFYRVMKPAAPPAIVDIAVSLALGLLAVLQSTKYPETIASYSLAAHEIGFIEARANGIRDEGGLSEYVSGAENAFSREHTQWIARQDI